VQRKDTKRRREGISGKPRFSVWDEEEEYFLGRQNLFAGKGGGGGGGGGEVLEKKGEKTRLTRRSVARKKGKRTGFKKGSRNAPGEGGNTLILSRKKQS